MIMIDLQKVPKNPGCYLFQDSKKNIIYIGKAKDLKKGNIIELITTFLPAPGIDILKSKGYSFWCKKEEGDIIK